MSTLMPPPSKPVVRQAAPVAQQPDVRATMQAVDRTVHVTTLLLRTAAYATATAMISGASFGPSFLFGALLGDLLGCVAQAPSTLRRAPIATAAECALLAGFTIVGATQVGWPADSELRALFLLAAFATFSARIGWAFGGRDDRVL
jgi:hypothetical protein